VARLFVLSLAVLEVQLGKVSEEKGISVHIHCTVIRNDFIGHNIKVLALSFLNYIQ